MKKIHLILICFAFFLCGATGAFGGTIKFDDFSDLSGMTLKGSTNSIHSSGNVRSGGQDVLRLTNGFSQSGGAFLEDSVALTTERGFSAYFSFQVTNSRGLSQGDGQGADGIVFTLQKAKNRTSPVIGNMGGGLGYKGIDNSVGVEFDTWYNCGVDANGNHAGINTNGNLKSRQQKAVSERFNNGEIWHSWIDYNPDTKRLEVRLADAFDRPEEAFLSKKFKKFFNGNFFVGFTSGTGGAAGDHDIRSFAFSDSYNPGFESPVPEPGTMVLVGLGLIGLAGVGRRKTRG